LTVTALSQIGDTRALRLMIDGLADPDPYVQNLTYKHLAEIYSEEEIDEICSSLERRLFLATRLSGWKQFLGIDAAPNPILDAFGFRENEDLTDDIAPAFVPEPVPLAVPVAASRPLRQLPSFMQRLRERVEDQWYKWSGI